MRLLLQLFSCVSLIALTKKRNPKLVWNSFKKKLQSKEGRSAQRYTEKMFGSFSSSPFDSLFFDFFFVFLFLPDYRVMMNDVIDQPGRQSLIWSFILGFHNATNTKIFVTSYVLIGNLRLACCCDCSIGHEIAKKRLSQVGQQTTTLVCAITSRNSPN